MMGFLHLRFSQMPELFSQLGCYSLYPSAWGETTSLPCPAARNSASLTEFQLPKTQLGQIIGVERCPKEERAQTDTETARSAGIYILKIPRVTLANAREHQDTEILRFHPNLTWMLLVHAGFWGVAAAIAQCNATLLQFALICCSNQYKREERELIQPAGLNELYLTSMLLEADSRMPHEHRYNQSLVGASFV